MTQRCLGWLAVAVVFSSLTLCPSTGLAAHDLRALLALRVNLSDQGEIRVLLREGDVLARMARCSSPPPKTSSFFQLY